MNKKELMIRTEILDYWIDREINKAYCLIKFTDMSDKGKKSNVYLEESDYYDN